jgi:hypothetical protein
LAAKLGELVLLPLVAMLPPPEAAPAIAEPPRASAVIEAAINMMVLILSVMAFLSVGEWADFPRRPRRPERALSRG